MASSPVRLCIGNGAGPKNVLVQFPDGKKQVVTYMTWKHKLQGVKLADQYQTVFGHIQQFGDKEWLSEREVGDQTVREFTVKSAVTGNFVKVQLWPEYADTVLAVGAFVTAEGPLQVNEKGNTTYRNLTARKLTVTLPEAKSGEAKAAPKRTRKSAENAPI